MYGNNAIFGKLDNQKNKSRFIIITFLMMVIGINIFSVVAIAENPDTISNYFIESRFKLWDTHEKMLDEDFYIHLIYMNNTVNHSFDYYIQINDNIYNGTSNFTHVEKIHLNNNQIINLFIIKINNQTLLHESNIRIIGGVSSDGISRSIEPYTISLSPLQWTSKGRNIFYSVIVGGLVSIFFGYRIVKKYRSKYGVHVIED